MDDQPTTSDDQLVTLAIRGCESSFHSLFEHYYPLIHAYAWKICGDTAAADDIAQQTFIKAASALVNYRQKNRFKPWIYQIALNTARDHLRATSRYRQRLKQLETPQSQTPPVLEKYGPLADVLKKLPPTIQETVLLVFAQGLTQKEAAQVLQCPEGTVAWRISEARKILKEPTTTPCDENS